MQKRPLAPLGHLVLGLCTLLSALPAAAGDGGRVITMEITNTTHAIFFTPLLVTAHARDAHLFQLGTAASAELQAMAEGGDLSGLLVALGGTDGDTVADPAGGLLAPGETATVTLTVHRHAALSIVAMMLPTNDGFVGLDALPIPAKRGLYTYGLTAYDAGTEANNELINGGGAPGVLGIPADPGGRGGTGGTGVTTMEANHKVHVHRGILGDTDPDGGISDLDVRMHRWQNPVAQLRLRVGGDDEDDD